MINTGMSGGATYTFTSPEDLIAERARKAFDIAYEAVGVENEGDDEQLDKHEERRLLAMIASPLLAEIFKALAPPSLNYVPYTYVNNGPVGTPFTTQSPSYNTPTTGPSYSAPDYYGKADPHITAHFESMN